jgi:cytoskeleton protein RodZ
MEAVDTDLGQGIGVRLRRAREQRGLGVEECAERLYLPASVLEALESEQFASLGAGVYARGHLRRYAGLLEMDAPALEQMMLQRLAAAPDLATIVTRRVGNTNPGRRLGLLPVAIVAAALALAVLVWWSARHAAESPPAPTRIPIPATQVAPAPSAAPAAPADSPAAPPRAAVTPADEDADTARLAADLAPAPPTDTPLVVASANPRPVPPAASAPAAAKSPVTTAAPRRRVAPTPAEPAPPRETQSDYTNFDF